MLLPPIFRLAVATTGSTAATSSIAMARSSAVIMADDDEKNLSPSTTTNLGALLVAGAGTIFAIFLFALTSLLGWDVVNTADNNGLGTPLTTQEVRALGDAQKRASASKELDDDIDNDRPLTPEEAREEQAIMRVIAGAPIRAK